MQQDTNRQIFYLACRELPNKIHTTGNQEECIFFKGFKISRINNYYIWEDIRYDDYYEPVNKFITQNILKEGFCKTLTKVMVHNDIEKLENLTRDVEKLNAQINYWVKKSMKNWNRYKEQKTGIINNETLSEDEKKEKLRILIGRHDKNKDLYSKKRRVLIEEKDNLKADISFYKVRVQNHK